MEMKYIPVDFGNCDEDGAVRFVTRGTIEYLQRYGIELSDGLRVVLTDTEVMAEGTCTLRGGIWVAKIDKWLR